MNFMNGVLSIWLHFRWIPFSTAHFCVAVKFIGVLIIPFILVAVQFNAINYCNFNRFHLIDCLRHNRHYVFMCKRKLKWMCIFMNSMEYQLILSEGKTLSKLYMNKLSHRTSIIMRIRNVLFTSSAYHYLLILSRTLSHFECWKQSKCNRFNVSNPIDSLTTHTHTHIVIICLLLLCLIKIN